MFSTYYCVLMEWRHTVHALKGYERKHRLCVCEQNDWVTKLFNYQMVSNYNALVALVWKGIT